jgi:8-oxo-dGTP pyrophosphatase MutT (NUDIX family)
VTPPPRESATVLLLRDDPFEVLMVSRAARGSFASALVFPGGVIDPGDRDDSWRRSVTDFDEVTAAERPLRIGAIREVWEETGILVSPQDAVTDSVPPRLGLGFRDTLAASGAYLQLNSLTHFGHWITPLQEPKRFDTHFFLAAVDRDTVAEPDGVETLAAEWLPPARAAELALSGERPIIFPTMLNLLRVAESDSVAAAIAAARARPRVTVAPVMDVFEDGTRRLTIPAEAGYSVLEWTDHR